MRRIHIVDGQQMTVPEIAEMLGITESALYQRKSNLHGCSYQVIVDMYRENQFERRDDRWERHMVDGQWITVKEAAEMCGVKPKSIREWRFQNKKRGKMPTLAEAVEHFRKYRTGEVKRYKGSVGVKHIVHGRRMTVKQAAERYGTTKRALYHSMSTYGRSLDAAVRHVEKLQLDRAQKEIMTILGGK